MDRLAVVVVVATVMTMAMLDLAAVEAPDPPSLVGKPAPEIKAEYWLNSPELTLGALRGKVVVLEFWATWCPPCRESIPHLIKLQTKYADKGVVIIGLTNETQKIVEPFVKKMKMNYPVGGGSSKSATDYRVSAIPTAFIVDTTGIVAWQGHPLDEAFDKNLEEQAAKIKSDEKDKPAARSD